MADERPIVVIVDGSVAVTGALVSAARQAELLRDLVSTVLVLPLGHQVPAARLTAFAEVIDLRIVPLRKTATSLLTYLPALVVGTLRLRRELHRLGASRLQLNDFYLLHGVMLRLLGFRGRIVTFVRIDPTRFGLAGRIWLKGAKWSSDEIVAVSRFIQRLLGAHFPSRLVYEQVVPAPPKARAPGQTLLFVGNFIAGKGQDDAVAAFNRIAPDFPEARLRLVGGDMGLARNRAFRARVERLAADGPAAERIEVRGPVDDIGPLYAEACAALNFSASESFSITCLDASAAGLAVIATKCGGPEEIIEHERTGFLVDCGDVGAMAERMDWLLRNPGQAQAMGVAGQSLIQRRFSRRQATRRFVRLFRLD